MNTKRFSNLLIAVALVMVAVLTLFEARSTKALANQNADIIRRVAVALPDTLIPANEAAYLHRNRSAEAERLTAMGEFYTRQALEIRRSRASEIDRWVAMGDFYTRQALELQRSRATEAARWEAMVKYYMPSITAAPASEAELLQRSRAAEVARWNAMAEFYSR